MTAFYIATAALWIVAIATIRQHLIDAGMHPRRGQREEKRATHRDPKFNRSVSPVGAVHHHHGGVSK